MHRRELVWMVDFSLNSLLLCVLIFGNGVGSKPVRAFIDTDCDSQKGPGKPPIQYLDLTHRRKSTKPQRHMAGWLETQD